MSAELAGKTAIVTGGGGGIGRAIAEALASAGCAVVVCGRRQDKLAETTAAIAAAGGKAVAVAADITLEESVARLFNAAVAAHGPLDILVNNAGAFGGGPSDQLPLAEWRAMLEVNLTGAFICCREALRHMKPHKSGRIINIGSTAAKVPRARSAAYAASKYGLDGLTRSLAIEAREYGVGVSIIHPGNTIPGVWSGQEEKVRGEGLMDAANVARIAVAMAAMPPDVLFYESIVLPLSMPFLGRG
jgi:NAD(P)-dependent dehydrogenase (short-subunit alcohol dehydrogenase family)